MQLSKFTIRKLAKILNGDTGHTPYLSGPELVELFNRFGSRDVYGEGFPSRWKYVEDKLHELIGDPTLSRIIEAVVDPRLYFGTDFNVSGAIFHINELLSYDGYSLIESGKEYKITSVEGVIIDSESLAEIENDYVTEQIRKCDNKILSEDYDGAITNARTLVETVIVDILSIYDSVYEHKGDMTKAYSRIKAVLNLDPSSPNYIRSVKQTLSGLNSIVHGLATMRNEMSDAHASRYRPEKHHAKLAVNSAKTLSEFLIDTLKKQSGNTLKAYQRLGRRKQRL